MRAAARAAAARKVVGASALYSVRVDGGGLRPLIADEMALVVKFSDGLNLLPEISRCVVIVTGVAERLERTRT